MRKTITILALGAATIGLTGCDQPPPPPADQITEIEEQQAGDGNGGLRESVAVETYDGNQYSFRDGVRISVGDRLWKQVDLDDLLVEQPNAREGDGPDINHEGEQSDDEGAAGEEG